MIPDLDIACGRVLWALKHTGGLRADQIHRYALGIEPGESIKAILARLEARGEARLEGDVWRAVG